MFNFHNHVLREYCSGSVAAIIDIRNSWTEENSQALSEKSDVDLFIRFYSELCNHWLCPRADSSSFAPRHEPKSVIIRCSDADVHMKLTSVYPDLTFSFENKLPNILRL